MQYQLHPAAFSKVQNDARPGAVPKYQLYQMQVPPCISQESSELAVITWTHIQLSSL